MELNTNNVKINLQDFSEIKNTKKCLHCNKKKPTILITQYIYEKDEIGVSAYCADCFKKEIPEYTLERYCIACDDNFKCVIQKKLFSKKEIKEFKEEFWGRKIKNGKN